MQFSGRPREQAARWEQVADSVDTFATRRGREGWRIGSVTLWRMYRDDRPRCGIPEPDQKVDGTKTTICSNRKRMSGLATHITTVFSTGHDQVRHYRVWLVS